MLLSCINGAWTGGMAAVLGVASLVSTAAAAGNQTGETQMSPTGMGLLYSQGMGLNLAIASVTQAPEVRGTLPSLRGDSIPAGNQPVATAKSAESKPTTQLLAPAGKKDKTPLPDQLPMVVLGGAVLAMGAWSVLSSRNG